MPALNLLFVVKDNVFDCYNLVTGRIKQRYVVGNAAPAIADTLQANTTLVLTSHCSAQGTIVLGSQRMAATAYALAIRNGINAANRNRVTRIVHLACTANAGVQAVAGITQVAPTGVITLNGANGTLTVAGEQAMTVNDVIALGQGAHGWVVTAPAAAQGGGGAAA